MEHEVTLFSGSANAAVAQAIAFELGVNLSGAKVRRSPDGEVSVQLLRPVRRQEATRLTNG